MTYTVGRHPAVQKQIEALNRTGAQALMRNLFERVQEALSRDPTLELYKLRDDLSLLSRLKMGRFRVFFIYSTELKRVTILYVGMRKAGDSNDPYEQVPKLLRRGVFDACLEELGVRRS